MQTLTKKKKIADCVKIDQVNPKVPLRRSSAEVWIWSGYVAQSQSAEF